MNRTDDLTESTSQVVGHLDDLAVGDMKMVKVGDTAVALIRSETGVHAIDNACPHQGYGLVTGALADGVVTCQWHNWKFDAATGRCLVGEEDVPCHRVDISGGDNGSADGEGGGEVTVTVEKPSRAEQRARLWPSLRRGLENDYVGQMARDSARLLDAGASPVQIMAEAMKVAAPKADDGIGHEMALAADALAIAEVRSGDDRLLALVQGLSGLSETTRGYPVNPVPSADASIDVVAAVEAEDLDAAKAGLMGRIERGDDPAALRATVIDAVSPHHLGYGHGVIYTQKSFELLDRAGWELAPISCPTSSPASSTRPGRTHCRTCARRCGSCRPSTSGRWPRRRPTAPSSIPSGMRPRSPTRSCRHRRRRSRPQPRPSPPAPVSTACSTPA